MCGASSDRSVFHQSPGSSLVSRHGATSKPHHLLLFFCSVRTCARKANNSSSEANGVACPDTTCSTRPAQRPRPRSVSVRNCTTKAHCGNKGEGPPGAGVLWAFPPRRLRFACTLGSFVQRTVAQDRGGSPERMLTF